MKTDTLGTVYLIGAGPGDPGLITVKGLRKLHSCDAIIYDHLVSDELIVAIPPGREMYYVGKKAAQHPVPQDEINALMLRLAREGKSVARLKGSDPLIFGRGGEEAKYLKEHGISFEIVTGVTSGIAGPAYCGIPCTDREKASLVMFVTGHKASDKLKTSVPWEWIAKVKNGTIVIYMGVGEIANICRQLIDGGMDPAMPVAAIERGTYPSQRLVTAPLVEMPIAVEENNVKPPALFVIGHVVELQPWLEWFADRPLFGIRIMVTRPADQSKHIYRHLRSLGAEPMPFPTIATEAWDDPEGWRGFEAVDGTNKWIVFTSENGVRYFFDAFDQRFGDVRKLGGFKIAAIGVGTQRAMKQYRISADFMPSKYTVNDLTAEMAAKLDLTGAEIIRVRGNLAPDTMERKLPAAGARIIPLTVYRTFHPAWPDGLRDKLFENPPHAFIFTSGSTVDGLFELLSADEVKRLTTGAEIFSMGPSTTKIIKGHGLTISAEAAEHSIPGLLSTLVDYYKK